MALKKGWLADGITSLLSKGMTGLVSEVSDTYSLDVPKDKSLPEKLINLLDTEVVEQLSSVGALVGSPMGLVPFLSVLYQAGLAETQAQRARSIYTPSRLPPETIARLKHRKYEPDDKDAELGQDYADQGWDANRIKALDESYRVLLSAGEIRELYLREKFGTGDKAKTEAIARLQHLGIAEDDATKLFDIFFFIPPPQDLVNWSAKEVFEPDAIEKYGLAEEFDKLNLDLFAQAGVSPEQARNYWMAHWQHPGLQTVQELLHRTAFTEADFKEWFKLVEIPPFCLVILSFIALVVKPPKPPIIPIPPANIRPFNP